MGSSNTTRKMGKNSKCPICHKGGASVSGRRGKLKYCTKHETPCQVHEGWAFVTEDGCARCAHDEERRQEKLKKEAEAMAAAEAANNN